jgi:tRNA wybutosine-synthesizing protein 2
MEQFSSSRITLVVYEQHVKTVKQALERTGQLDRSNKITPESRNKEGQSILGSLIVSRHDADRPECVQSATGTPVITPEAMQAPPSSKQQRPFPTLQFDATNSQWVYPESLQDGVHHGDQVAAHQGSGRTAKVARSSGKRDGQRTGQQRMYIPTTIPYRLQVDESAITLDEEHVNNLKLRVLHDLSLSALSGDISFTHHVPVTTSPLQRVHKNPIHKALSEALTAVLDQSLSSNGLTVDALVSAFPDGYSVYKPMLLLPHNALSSPPWKRLIASHKVDSVTMRSLWQVMAEAVGATHVAINSPIPLSTSSTSASSPNTADKENILRSPVNLTPLYGDFGNTRTPQTISTPTATDFAKAIWVTTRQNGIWQTWAPLYTMFSRGNIREKKRILSLPSVTTGLDGTLAAVDLYAGIGYFAFSYRRSGEGLEKGIKQVLCWEINPWSVEGLRRGAEMNGWTCRVLKQEDMIRLRQMGPVNTSNLRSADFIVFQKSNEGADLDYSSLPSPRLPVRHVNLGLLPSSKLSWCVAVAMLDRKRGGWIHVHENVGAKEVETMQKKLEMKFQELVYATDSVPGRKVSVAHVERVKMYAPGVVHCVFDVRVEGHI